jgi:hypothetical protein
MPRTTRKPPPKAWSIIKNVPLRNWSWVYFKFSIALWTVVLALNTPKAVSDTAQAIFVVSYLGATTLGAVISVVGMVIAAQPTKRWYMPVGTGIELGGILFMFIGPLCYAATQVAIILDGAADSDGRIHLIFLSHALVAALMVRLVVIGPRFVREVKLPRKSVA